MRASNALSTREKGLNELVREMRMGGTDHERLIGHWKDLGFYLKGMGDCSWLSALKWEWEKQRGMQWEMEGEAEAGAPEAGKEGKPECELPGSCPGSSSWSPVRPCYSPFPECCVRGHLIIQ